MCALSHPHVFQNTNKRRAVTGKMTRSLSGNDYRSLSRFNDNYTNAKGNDKQ
jgi:prophage maintenance system killer protein